MEFSICFVVFFFESFPYSHTRSTHEGKIFNCNICKFQTPHKYYLSIHIRSKHLKEKYPCKECDFITTFKISLSRHIKNVHQKSDVICIECNRTIQEVSIDQHRKVFHSIEGTNYSCQICSFQTKHRSSLSKHLQQIHMKS